MNKIIYILLLLPSLTFGQDCLNGKYQSGTELNSQCFTFLNDSSFSYYAWTENSETRGNGYYKTNHDKLSFIFTDFDTTRTTYILIKDTTCILNDSKEFFIYVKDFDNRPVSFGLILCKDSLNGKIHGATDIHGNCTLNVNTSSDSINLYFQIMGYKKCFFTIATNCCKNIFLQMAPTADYLIKGVEIWDYTIIRNTKRKLILEHDNKRFIYYKE